MRSALEHELGRTIEFHQAIPSTQARALALADEPAARLIVTADEQTAGQGTRGRAWHAPAGTALLASWLYRPAPAEPALTSLLAAVAVARALDALGAQGIALRWPNDVLLGEEKVAGILANGRTDDRGGVLVLGIGINVGHKRTDFPDELRTPATSLALAGVSADRLALLALLTREIDRVVDGTQRAAALAEWRSRAPLLGREVRVLREGEVPLEGRATGLAEDGALLVETPYGPQRIVAGEVSIR